MIGTRQGPDPLVARARGLLDELARVDGELLVVSPLEGPARPPDRLRWIRLPTANLLELRLHAIGAARGAVIACGEDHARPSPGWCSSVLRAHAEHPDAAAVAGCLRNATDTTLWGRANFLAFAAPFRAPMPELHRPPPVSAISFKASALDEMPLEGHPGVFESVLLPAWFAAGRIVADDRILVDHFQDHGMSWSLRNAFANTRTNYGYAAGGTGWRRRREVSRWVLRRLASRQWVEASASGLSTPERAAVALLVAATVAGALAGVLLGPGSSAQRVA